MTSWKTRQTHVLPAKWGIEPTGAVERLGFENKIELMLAMVLAQNGQRQAGKRKF